MEFGDALVGLANAHANLGLIIEDLWRRLLCSVSTQQFHYHAIPLRWDC
jgi:hypothetical protein